MRKTRDDVGAEIEVRRHPAARRMTLRISQSRRAVIVTIPLRCRLDEADTFLNRHIDWVRERLDRLPDPVPFAHGVAMPLRGTPHDVVFTADTSTRIVTTSAANASHRAQIIVPGTLSTAPQRLHRWIIEQARQDLDVSVAKYCQLIGVNAKRITVRDQTSRWGSCSSTTALSFSWRLILAPAFVLDYVAAHEVAHLKHMNHGVKFWRLVASMTPELEEAKDWLQLYGPDLHRYGA